MNYYLGIDFGTSGARAIVIDQDNTIQTIVTRTYTESQPLQLGANHALAWEVTLFALIAEIPLPLRQAIRAIAINGTSGTALLCDHKGKPITEPLLYDDGRGSVVVAELATIAPAHHPVISATSTLAKLLWWRHHLLNLHQPLLTEETLGRGAGGRIVSPSGGCGGLAPHPTLARNTEISIYLMHQADWLAFLLHGKLGITDYHNALKLGYDIAILDYPDWLIRQDWGVVLPEVVAPGTPIAPVQPEVRDRWQLPSTCQVCAGTTDSIAAFLASGACHPGEAVTSLGSTLVLKLLSETRIDDARYGIYSHRLGDLWLVGGASNTGGAVLKQFFTDAELQTLSAQIPSDRPSPLEYYPLLKPGERFPINDPHLLPRLEPRPDNPVEFLHGLLESIARIEARGYQLLYDLGATPLTHVYTAGGGAQNLVWTAIRQRYLGVPCLRSHATDAAYGSALLARQQRFTEGLQTIANF